MDSSTFNPNMAHVGLYLPKELVAEIDKAKGYYTRNKFLQKITEEYLASQQKELNQLLASGVASNRS